MRWNAAHERRDVDRSRCRAHAEAHAALEQLSQVVHVGARRLDLVEDPSRALDQARAGVGHRHAPRRAIDERHAELGLQRADLSRQRRLRHVRTCGGAREVLLLRQRDQVPELPDLHAATVLDRDHQCLGLLPPVPPRVRQTASAGCSFSQARRCASFSRVEGCRRGCSVVSKRRTHQQQRHDGVRALGAADAVDEGDRVLRPALALVGRRPRRVLGRDLGVLRRASRAGRGRCSARATCPAPRGSPAHGSTTPSTCSVATTRARRRSSSPPSSRRPGRLELGRAARPDGPDRAGLRASASRRGDRVAAYLPNVPETVAAFLACASLGAIWSSCSPDFGARSVDRPLRADRAEGPARGRRLPLRRQGLRPPRGRGAAARGGPVAGARRAALDHLGTGASRHAQLGDADRDRRSASRRVHPRAVRPSAVGGLLAPARPACPSRSSTATAACCSSISS